MILFLFFCFFASSFCFFVLFSSFCLYSSCFRLFVSFHLVFVFLSLFILFSSFCLFSSCFLRFVSFHLVFLRFVSFHLLFSKKILFAISCYFLAEISIFEFVRCYASPNSENGGGCMFFVCFFLLGFMFCLFFSDRFYVLFVFFCSVL